MYTRDLTSRPYDMSPLGIVTPLANAWHHGLVVRTGTVPLLLAPPTPAADPSDPRTWTRPRIFTR